MNTRLVKDLATIGLGIGAPLMLVTGIGIGVTLFQGAPVFLVALFLFAGGLTVVSALGYLAADAIERTAAEEKEPS